jgi:hypothetical protein
MEKNVMLFEAWKLLVTKELKEFCERRVEDELNEYFKTINQDCSLPSVSKTAEDLANQLFW